MEVPFEKKDRSEEPAKQVNVFQVEVEVGTNNEKRYSPSGKVVVSLFTADAMASWLSGYPFVERKSATLH